MISTTAPGQENSPDLQPIQGTKSSYIRNLLRGSTIAVGPVLKSVDFNYTRPDEEEYAGSLTEGSELTYFIRYGTPCYFSENKRWGYNFELEYSNFHMTKQRTGSRELDLGTEVEGHYWYLRPIGYILSGPIPEGKPEFSWIGGLGLGLGYIQVEGDIILTEDGSDEHVSIDQRGFGISANLILEAYYWNLVSRLNFGGTVLGDDGAAHDIFEISWDLGYVFRF